MAVFMNLETNIAETKFDIGRNLQIVRKSLRLSHNELVALTGLTRPILSTIENASANPTLETLVKISSALNISNDMLIMSKIKFEILQKNLKSVFEKERNELFDFHILPKSWNNLMQFSGNDSKANCSKVAKICFEIINQNSTNFSESQNNMVLGATLGIIFQEDGFKHGLEFGAWLGDKLKTR
jgi:transcriptional regulator with XRE-family HTH domain